MGGKKSEMLIRKKQGAKRKLKELYWHTNTVRKQETKDGPVGRCLQQKVDHIIQEQ
jgi:hypothetical protein